MRTNMKKLAMILVVAGIVLATGGTIQALEPLPDTPGAWRIYPDNTEEYFGNDRVANTWGSDNYCSIHAALGYSGNLISPDYQGPNDPEQNWKIRYWEVYDPPPPGTIIELRGPGVWNVGGDGAQGGQGREKMKSLVMRQPGITIRGKDYDDGTGTMVQQEIYSPSGATTAIIYAEAADLTFENLHIEGAWPTNYGEYAIAILRYPITHPDALSWDYDLGGIVIGPVPVEPAPGLIVNGCTFTNLRAPFDQRPTLEDVTIVNNTVDSCYYNIFKKGVTFTGDNTITSNAFNHVGEGKSYPALQILDNTGTTLIDNNTFSGWRPGAYAIEIQNDDISGELDLGCENNIFVDQVGGSGASYQLYLLTSSGGHAVGYRSSDDVIFSCGPPAPRVVKQDVIDDLSALLPTGDKKTDHRIEKAIEHIQKSLNIDPKDGGQWNKHELWLDDNHLDPKHGSKVFNEEKKAVKELVKIDAPDVSGAIDALVSADETLARTAIDEAIAAAEAVGCGEESNDPECKKTLKEIAKAQSEMAKAQEELDHIKKDGTPDPKYDKAIDHYKKAWKHAQKALGHMPEDEELE